MEFRKAIEEDVKSIVNIIKQAQTWFKEQGIDQWQDNYPNLETVLYDINKNYGYVLLKNNVVVGTAAVIFDGEKTYDTIYNGKWISNDEYAVIHRMAIDPNYKGLGLATLFFNCIEKTCLNKGIHSIKVDTHEENIPMQKSFYKNGFQYCGIIYLEDKSKRLAFEKILTKGT
ncbi:GNAT family N-acetyltransferase [Proteiniborus sp.]|uniref:GNAT family N-acetyltransferase n=1 Tax=Proteiniborus sp. TaxID=2079015 RepID=UPI0033303DF1